jgi:hypothetical protein
MKEAKFILAAFLLLLAVGCKKETRIRHELSGVWEIEKAEITNYVNGEVDSVTTMENLGRINLTDDGSSSTEYNECYLEFSENFWPRGFLELNNTWVRQNRSCKWYADQRTRDRITFWDSGGFSGTDEIFVIYTRIKNANGPGRREQWMYVGPGASGAGLIQEVLYVKLVDASGKVVW